jgi:hypothetical protein
MVFSGSGNLPNWLKRRVVKQEERNSAGFFCAAMMVEGRQITWTEQRSEERYGGVRDMRGSLPNMKPESADEMEWTERQDLVIQIASPEVAAEKLGRSLAAVLARRQELGLPDPLSTRERLARQKKD